MQLDALLDSLKEGERLPSERSLADTLEVSRRALRNAFVKLEAEGLVWRAVGRGTFKGRYPIEQPGGLAELKRRTSPPEVMEARLLLEPEFARMAAVRATPADLERLSGLVRKMRGLRDYETFSRWDGRFHRGIAEATRHQLFAALYDSVDTLRTELAWGTLQRRVHGPDWLERASIEHAEICEALIARDSNAAEDAMRRHLNAVYNVLTART